MELTLVKPEPYRNINNARFVRGLLCSLRLQDVVYLDVRGPHQQAFSLVAQELQVQKDTRTEATERMLRIFPDPITGEYRDLDSELLNLVRTGKVSLDRIPPTSAKFDFTVDTAHDELHRFKLSEQLLLGNLATIFMSFEGATFRAD